ncbi:leukocyte-associated immunoglobulin-like receptor 1 isoform X7 [Suricata suricatta]|uniref:leukocyte-associated immunoglobulin-like receptor 1 isoform X7 n=1 Tax=Suricata suricatta TaxID=37032 RepID=UPI001155B8CE|nr:leukocyte-associated immunoglobulin-like receptor 1 isoform X7 [Suricata suricatta]
MCPHSTTFLALALCLGPGLHAQKGSLPPPLIHAEPGPEVPLGQRVTIVCRSLAAYEVFRLEKEGGVFQQDVHQRSPRNTEARFRIAAGTGAGGRYQCLYHVGDTWSDRSETLALVVTDTPGDVGCSPPRTCNPTDGRSTPRGSGDPSPVLQASDHMLASSCPGDTRTYEDDSKSPDLSTEHVYILVGVSVALFLCLLLLALALLHCQRRKKRRSAQRLTSSRGHQIRQQLTDFLRRTGQRPAQPLLQEAPRT